MGRIDVITGTLGKALGGASGGYTSGRKEIIELLRQRSRPYLFSNTLAPAIAGASLKVLEMLTASTELRDKLEANTRFFREGMAKLGFHHPAGHAPDRARSCWATPPWRRRLADAMLAKGVYVIGFSYPVVPQGKARIRTQISAAHSREGPGLRHREIRRGQKRTPPLTGVRRPRVFAHGPSDLRTSAFFRPSALGLRNSVAPPSAQVSIKGRAAQSCRPA